ncbi:GDP-D-glucose phosphorylase 1-like isoform X1 [Acropora palmata]|uniref:GDP-D-glucose phosphorylase 1-like isoform X1 n=2 Tax=Acropora palmata TaxID=6131 RepID=UPI003DA0BD68
MQRFRHFVRLPKRNRITFLCARSRQPTFMSSSKITKLDHQFFYSSNDFHWPNVKKVTQAEPSNFDKELTETWNAAANAGYFAYKLDKVEGRLTPGKYSLYIQLNELRFTKRRKPDPFSSVSQPFNSEKFNFTKVPKKEALFELCPNHRVPSSASCSDDHHIMLINLSPMEYGHSLLVPSVNSGLPQILTEEGILLGLETAMLSNHRGFRVGFNSLCAYCSVNHLHFHVWYNKLPSYLETVDVIPVCEDLFEVRDYATTAFVFELGPHTDARELARKVHQMTSHFIRNDVAHTLHIMRGNKCISKTLQNGFLHAEEDCSVLRVFVWPRNSVTGANVKSSYADSDDRPMAVCEFGGFVAVETRGTFNTFTEEQFCEYMKRATLPEEEFVRHKEAVRRLLTQNS